MPQGSYSLKVSICKQLDGKFLSCFKVDGQQLAGKSLPVRHNGNFYDVEISFGQSIYTVSEVSLIHYLALWLEKIVFCTELHYFPELSAFYRWASSFFSKLAGNSKN